MSINVLRTFRFPAYCLFALSFLLSAHGQDRFDWMPADASSAQLRSDEGGERIIPEITLTKTPKITADLSKFTKVYTIDLARFGINNEGKNAAETSNGLNKALQEAKAEGANHIVFPAGTYLISETIPLLVDHKDTVIDFGGATLQIATNGLPRYSVVEIIDGADNVRLTNGTLRGDKDSHDFKTSPGTHEWGAGLRFISGKNLEVDHLTSCNFTGDGVGSSCTGTRNRDELLQRIVHSIYVKDLESGAFDDKGEKVANSEKTRTIKPFDMTKSDRPFELGYMGGYMGYPFIKGRVYRANFYNADMKFLEQQKCLQYRKITVPDSARWMHLEFNQPAVTDIPAHAGAVKGGWVARITTFRASTDVHFHHNVLTQNRRLGMAYCGGQKWLIEDNLFTENGGTAPAYGVDFEDGSELMQDVVFRNNKFKDNRAGDLVICAGSELLFENNQFEKSVITWGRPHNYEFRHNTFNGGNVHFSTRTGVASIHDNHYQNCKLAITFDTKAVADGLVRKAGQTVATPPLVLKNETLSNVADITGTYFYFANCDIQGSSFVAGKETRLVRLVGGKLEDSSLKYEADGPAVDVKVENVTGKLVEEGPGMNRKATAR